MRETEGEGKDETRQEVAGVRTAWLQGLAAFPARPAMEASNLTVDEVCDHARQQEIALAEYCFDLRNHLRWLCCRLPEALCAPFYFVQVDFYLLRRGLGGGRRSASWSFWLAEWLHLRKAWGRESCLTASRMFLVVLEFAD